MKTEKWQTWINEHQQQLPETSQKFLRDATLEEVEKNAVIFLVNGKKTRIQRIGSTSWTVPSSLFVPYGSISSLFQGLNLLLEENV